MTPSPFTCIRCQTSLPSGSRFCPNCGLAFPDPVPSAPDSSKDDFPTADILQTNFQNSGTVFDLACPNRMCNVISSFSYDATGTGNSFSCPKCGVKFHTRVVKVRTANTRNIPSPVLNTPARQFSVRVFDLNGSQDLIQFESYGSQTFEFKAGDLVAFTYKPDGLSYIQNFTINRSGEVGKLIKKSGCCGCCGPTTGVAIFIVICLCRYATIHTVEHLWSNDVLRPTLVALSPFAYPISCDVTVAAEASRWAARPKAVLLPEQEIRRK